MAALITVRDTTTGKLILKTLEETGTMTASEALTANDLINIFDDAGTLKMQKADADNKPAHGFVKEAVALAAQGTAYYKGLIPVAASEGSYYTGVAGALTQTPDYSSGKVVQYIGYGTPDGVYFEPQEEAIVE
ncbi:MAG: hypothetical protein AB4290_09830 [Spirulina sp.]